MTQHGAMKSPTSVFSTKMPFFPSLPPLPWLSLLLEPFLFLLRFLAILPPRQHFWPHPSSPAEGYYARIFDPKTRTSILIIISSVRHATNKPHYIHFSLHRPGHPQLVIHDFPAFLPSTKLPLRAEGFFFDPDVGVMLKFPDYGVHVEVAFEKASRRPWVRGDPLSSPEGHSPGEFVHLMPLHWNVYTKGSRATYRVQKMDGTLLDAGSGLAHVEKNWGWEFPDRWMWIQGFLGKGQGVDDVEQDDQGIIIAGGRLMNMIVYMVTLGEYQFWPMPWPLSRASWEQGGDVWRLKGWKGWWLKGELVVTDGGEKILLNCPMKDGHANKNAEEALGATAKVRIWEREWWWPGRWRLVKGWELEDVALEFGGKYQILRKRS